MRNLRSIPWALSFLGFLALGCSAEPNDTPATADVSTAASASTNASDPTGALTQVTGPADIVVGNGPSASIIREVLTQALPFDAAPDPAGLQLAATVFADGEVSFAEYERAMAATVTCITSNGFEVNGPLRYPDGFLVVVPGVNPNIYLSYEVLMGDESDEETELALSAVMEQCDVQWRWWIEQVWLRQHEPSEIDIQRWLDRAWECARQRGYEISEPPSADDDLHKVVFPGSGCEPWNE